MAAPYTRANNVTGATNLNRELTWAEGDQNMEWIINRFNSIIQNTGIVPYDSGTTYTGTRYVSYNQNIWKHIGVGSDTGITPGTDGAVWQLSSIGEVIHAQNTDQYLDFGGVNQVSAADIKAYIELSSTMYAAQPIDYNDLMGLLAGGIVDNGLMYCISGVPGLSSNDRLYAVGIESDIGAYTNCVKYVAVWHDGYGKYSSIDGIASFNGEWVFSWKNNFHPYGVEIYFDETCKPGGSPYGSWWTDYLYYLLIGFGSGGRLTIDCVPFDNIVVFNNGVGVINQTGDITLKKGCTLNLFSGSSVGGGVQLSNVTVEENSTLNITGTTGGGSLTNIIVKGTISIDGIHDVENGVLGGRNTTASMSSPYDLGGGSIVDFGDIPLTKIVKITNPDAGGINTITGWYTPINHGLEIIFDVTSPTDFNVGSDNIQASHVGLANGMTGTQTVTAWAKFLLAPDGNAYLLDYI